jgi:hypothetical protein
MLAPENNYSNKISNNEKVILVVHRISLELVLHFVSSNIFHLSSRQEETDFSTAKIGKKRNIFMKNFGKKLGGILDSLKFHMGPPCPNLLHPAGTPPLRRYDRKMVDFSLKCLNSRNNRTLNYNLDKKKFPFLLKNMKL